MPIAFINLKGLQISYPILDMDSFSDLTALFV